MRKNRLIILIPLAMLVITQSVIPQNARITEEYVSFPTYPYSDPDPVPQPGKIYPYFRFDGYAAKAIPQEWKMVKMENRFIEVYITPEIGGKIWGAIEKSTGMEFVYFNHSVKFRDIAMRGPWTSGGIETNFGLIGHAPTCSSPVDYYFRSNDDGSVSCFIGALDLPSRTEWRIEINLPANASYFTTRALWYNPTPLEQSYYHWMNGAVRAAGNLEFAYPGTSYLGHDGKASGWPVNPEGREINFYEMNDFGSYKSYHVAGVYTSFFGGYWHNDGFGFGHYADYDDKPGKKIWIWGLARQGMIWEYLLTDTDGQYVEVQSGRLFNQEAASSTLTPFKHRGFIPYSSDTWIEYWFPVVGTRGVDQAIPEASVNLEKRNDSLHIWLCANTFIRDTLTLSLGEKGISAWYVTLSPAATAHLSLPFRSDPERVSLQLGTTYIIGPGGLAGQDLSRPMAKPAFDWNSTYGKYLSGKEKLRQRSYPEAVSDFNNCLESDPNYIPALTGLAQVRYRQMDYQRAWDLAGKALSIDTYDPEANFMYGLASLRTERPADAKDGFSIASASVEYRCGALTELARIFFREGDYEKAIRYAEKSLLANRLNIPAYEIMALAFRKMGLFDDATALLIDLLNIDPLNHFGRFEIFLPEGTEEAGKQLAEGIRNELPHETYLETALKYYHLGCFIEAIQVLENAPAHPVVFYWLAWLHMKKGSPDKAAYWLEQADILSPHLVFPFREESVEVLRWTVRQMDSWKPKYYLALILWHKGQPDKARELFNACGELPDYSPFYLAKGELFAGVDLAAMEKCFLRAAALDPQSWKTGYRLANYYIQTGKTGAALETSGEYFHKFPGNYYLGLQYAGLLNQNGQYDHCITLLRDLNVLPNEGATSGRQVWKETNLRRALVSLSEGNYSPAETFIAQALSWPENLGVGKPYDVDERLENFLLTIIYKATGNEEMLKNTRYKISGHRVTGGPVPEDLLTALALRELGETGEADRIMSDFTKASDQKGLQWCLAVYYGDKNLAATLIEASEKDQTWRENLTLDLLIQLDRNLNIFGKD